MQVPKETEKILNRLGYYDAAPQKVEEIQDYINEAAEFLRGSGVPPQKMTSATALAVKSIWARERDAGNEAVIVKKDGMIVALILQLKRGKQA